MYRKLVITLHMCIFTVMHVFLLFYYYKKAKAAETVKLEKQMEDEDNGRRKLRSPVCNYFEKTNFAICILCKAKYQHSNNTSNFSKVTQNR